MDRARILIVGDNIGTTERLTIILRKKGYDTNSASSGVEAVAMARKEAFDLVLLDLQLPDTEWSRLIPQLKKTQPDIAIIAITANVSPDATLSAIKEGVLLFLPKPLNMDIVLAKVEGAIRDQHEVLERRRALEALGESEEKFRLMAQVGKDVIFQCDLTGKFIYCSPAVERLLGFTQVEVIGAPLRGFLPPSEVSRSEEVLRRVISGEDVELQEFQVRNRDGEFIPVELNVVPLLKEKEIIGTQGIMRDVRERIRSQEGLRRRDRILEAIGFAAQRLMLSSDWREEAPFILKRLGEAADVCRVYVVENHTDGKGELRASQRFEWASPEVAPQIDNPDLQNFPYRERGFSRWVETHENGGIIHGHIRDFPAGEREILATQDIQSLAAVPIFTGNGWWGFIGFDSCRREVNWSVAELEALRAAAGMLGAAIHRADVEQQLDVQRSLTRETFEALVEGIGIVDQDERIIFCNPAYAAIFEEDPEELIGKNLRDFMDEETFRFILQQTAERRTGKTSFYEIPILTRKGKKRHIRVSVSPRFGADGSYIGAFGSLLDISEQVKAKEAVDRAEVRAREILMTSPAVLYRCDLDPAALEPGNPRPTFVSENVERIFGYRVEECLGPSCWWTEHLHPEDAPRAIEDVKELFERGRLTHDYRIRHKDGSYRWVVDDIVLIRDSRGRPAAFVGSWTDVTERKEREKALRAAEEKYHQIFTTSNHAILIFDAETRAFIDANEAAEKIYGYSRDEFLRMAQQDVTAELKESEAVIQQLLEREVIFVPLRYHRRKDGSVFPVEISASVFTISGKRMVCGIIRDITEQIRAEEELRRSHSLLADAERMARLGSWDWDIGRDEVRCSDVAIRLIGLEPPLTLSYERYLSFIHPDDRPAFIAEVTESLEGKPFNLEYRIIRADGAERVFHSIGRMTFDISGKPVRLTGTAQDITERIRAQKALMESEQKHRDLVNNAMVGVFQTNLKGEILFLNDAAVKIAGFGSADEMVSGGALPRHKNPEDRKKFIEALKKEGRVDNFLIENLTPAGETRQVLASAWIQGDIISGIAVDVTEQKKAESRLQESERELRLISETITDVFWLCNPEMSEIYYVSPAYEQVWGRPLSELYESPRSWIDTIHPEDREEVRNNLGNFAKRSYQIEYRILLPDDRLRWILDKGYPVKDEKGDIVAVVGVAADITERKLAEGELLNSQEQLRRLTGRLQSVREEERAKVARDIHDEIGQSLTAIRIELSRLGEKSPKDGKGLRKSVRSLTDLIDSTIEAVRRISTELRPGMLDHIGLAAAVEEYAVEFQQRTGIDCRVEADHFGPFLDSDRSIAIFRILQELLTNVARHAEATQVKVRLTQRNDRLVMSVQDNGKGIRKEDVSGPGSLGIIGMRERLYPWGGDLVFKGRRGKGTSVSVEMPLERELKGGQDDSSSPR